MYYMKMVRCRFRYLALIPLLILALGFDWSGKLKAKAVGLKSTDPQVRLSTLHDLALFDIAKSRPYLLALLNDQHQGVRLDAARVLAGHKDSAAVAPISAWLTSRDKKERQVAALVLGQIGSARAITPLSRTLSDPEPTVRRAATEALGRLGGASVIVPIIGRLDDTNAGVRQEAAEQLIVIGDARAVIPLLERFRDPAKDVRIAAIKAVGKLGDQRAVRAVMRVLGDSMPQVQIVAVQALASLRATGAVPELIKLFRTHKNRELLANIALALGRIGTEEAIVALVRGLRVAPRSAREGLLVAGRAAVAPLLLCLRGRLPCAPDQAVEILGKVGDRRAVSALIRELDLGRVRRDVVVRTLGALGDTRAQIALLGLLEDRDPVIREKALHAVGPILDARAADILVRLLDDREVGIVTQATIHVGQLRSRAAVPKLLSLLHSSPNVRVLARVLHSLGQIGDRRASKPLLAMLQYKDDGIRRRAADSLAALRDPNTVVPLLELAAPVRPRSRFRTSVRRAALVALRGVLRNTNNSHAQKRLETWAKQQPFAVAIAALGVLAAMDGDDSLDTLVMLSQRPAQPVQEAALSALGDLGDKGGTAALLSGLRVRDDRLSAAAAWSLGKLGDKKALPELHKIVRQEAWATRINATAALARLSALRSLSAHERGRLLRDAKMLLADRDPHVRANAATALGFLLPRTGSDPLQKLAVADKNPYVRAFAALALHRFPQARSMLRAVAKDDRNEFVRALAKAPPKKRIATEAANLLWLGESGKPLLGGRVVFIDPRGRIKAGYTDLRAQANEENIAVGWKYELIDGEGAYDNTREL